MPPLRKLQALLGLPRVRPGRVAFAGALLVVAIGLGIAAFVELIGALRIALLAVLHPAWVSLITGGVLLLIAGVLCLIAARISRPLPPPPREEAGVGDPLAEALLWVRAHPQEAALVAAVLGFFTGAVPEARETLRDLLKTR